MIVNNVSNPSRWDWVTQPGMEKLGEPDELENGAEDARDVADWADQQAELQQLDHE